MDRLTVFAVWLNEGLKVLSILEQTQKMPPGPERDALYRKMSRLLEVYMPVQIIGARYRNVLAQPRVIGFKKHPILPAEWMYIDIDMKK